jgi:SIR2-like domain
MPLLTPAAIKLVAESQNFDIIANAVTEGECVLFLGAGVNAGPEDDPGCDYPKNERPPLGKEFSIELARKCVFAKYSTEDPGNLQRVAMCYERVYGRHALIDEIRTAMYTGKKPSRALRALASLHFPLIITTNYDQLFEDALRNSNPPKHPLIGVYNVARYSATTDYPKFSVKHPFVFKLHGDIDVAESVVITDEDYIRFVMRMSDPPNCYPVPKTFLYRFATWPILFVGYSLLDYNLRLLFKTLNWGLDISHISPRYSVDPHPDPMIYDVWCNEGRYVTFIAQDTWTFVPALYQKVIGTPMP